MGASTNVTSANKNRWPTYWRCQALACWQPCRGLPCSDPDQSAESRGGKPDSQTPDPFFRQMLRRENGWWTDQNQPESVAGQQHRNRRTAPHGPQMSWPPNNADGSLCSWRAPSRPASHNRLASPQVIDRFIGHPFESSRAYTPSAARPAAGSRGERTIPSFFIRLRSVFGCITRTRAAPFGPSMIQAVSSRTFRMCAVQPLQASRIFAPLRIESHLVRDQECPVR